MPEVKKLLTLCTPLWALQDLPERAKIPSCWGLTSSVLPGMETGPQAAPGIVMSTILRPCRFHEIPSLSETVT